MTTDERAASLAHTAITQSDADALYELVKLIADIDTAHRRADCVDAVLDRIFPLMPAYESAKTQRAYSAAMR